MTKLSIEGPAGAKAVLILAPGAGAPATSPWMGRMASLLADCGLQILRFDFAYMAARQEDGSRRPPPKAEALVAEYEAALAQAEAQIGRARRLLIGGKSLGGRVASLAAASLHQTGRISGLVCLGYPFHPPKRPDQLRTKHLAALACPTLIVQGERDPFGTRAEVAGYSLAPAIRIHWATDGDHDLAPRKSSGATLDGNLSEAAAAVVRFAKAA
jgi:predicted alpha/beta-hydrolase family hydrolase